MTEDIAFPVISWKFSHKSDCFTLSFQTKSIIYLFYNLSNIPSPKLIILKKILHPIKIKS